MHRAVDEISIQLNKTLSSAGAQLAAEISEPLGSVLEEAVAPLKREREELMQGFNSLLSLVNELEKKVEMHESLRRRKEMDEVDELSKGSWLPGCALASCSLPDPLTDSSSTATPTPSPTSRGPGATATLLPPLSPAPRFRRLTVRRALASRASALSLQEKGSSGIK